MSTSLLSVYIICILCQIVAFKKNTKIVLELPYYFIMLNRSVWFGDKCSFNILNKTVWKFCNHLCSCWLLVKKCNFTQKRKEEVTAVNNNSSFQYSIIRDFIIFVFFEKNIPFFHYVHTLSLIAYTVLDYFSTIFRHKKHEFLEKEV